jgi:hypothetical protein
MLGAAGQREQELLEVVAGSTMTVLLARNREDMESAGQYDDST